MLCTALLVALAAAPAVAGEPQQRVRQTLDTVSAVLNDPQLQGSSNERERRGWVAKVMHESFDFRAMARESLGAHWAGLAPGQRDRFVDLFAQLFERSYDRLVLRFLGGSTTTYGAESVDAERAGVTTARLRQGGAEPGAAARGGGGQGGGTAGAGAGRGRGGRRSPGPRPRPRW